MADCKACRNYGKRCVPAANGKCDHFEPASRCMVCGRIIPQGHICLSCEGQEIPRIMPRIRTNGDKLRSMSNGEIALLLYNAGLESCSYDITPLDWWLKWLEREVDTT